MITIDSTAPNAPVQRVYGHDVLAILVALGLGVGLLSLTPILGFKVIPIAAFVFLLLPWFCRDPFVFLLFLIFTYPLIWPARIELPGGLPDLAYERVVVASILGLLLFRRLLTQKPLKGPGPWAALFLGCQTMMLIRGNWLGGVVKPEFGDYVNFAALPVACYWLTKNLLVSKKQLVWLLFTLFAASAAVGISGVVELLTVKGERVAAVSQEGTRLSYDDRAVGVAVNPAIYGAILGIGALVCLVAAQHASSWAARCAAGLCTVLFLAGVYLSLTRSAWLSVFGAIFVVQFYLGTTWRKTMPAFVAGAFLLVFAWGYLAQSDIMQNRVLETDHVSGRLERIAWCWDRFLERPLFGWGLGATDFLMPKAFPEGGFATSHNTHFSLMMDGGLLLILSFIPVLFHWYRTTRNVVGTSQRWSLERSAAIVMFGFVMIHTLSGMSLELRYFGFFNCLLWIAGATIERSSEMLAPPFEKNDSPPVGIGALHGV